MEQTLKKVVANALALGDARESVQKQIAEEVQKRLNAENKVAPEKRDGVAQDVAAKVVGGVSDQAAEKIRDKAYEDRAKELSRKSDVDEKAIALAARLRAQGGEYDARDRFHPMTPEQQAYVAQQVAGFLNKKAGWGQDMARGVGGKIAADAEREVSDRMTAELSRQTELGLQGNTNTQLLAQSVAMMAQSNIVIAQSQQQTKAQFQMLRAMVIQAGNAAMPLTRRNGVGMPRGR